MDGTLRKLARTARATALRARAARVVSRSFVLLPFAHTVGLSFFEWDGLGPAVFTGLDNYREALRSELVRDAFGHALVLIFFFGVLPVLLALPLAASGSRTAVPGGNALRTVIFLPQAISTVVIGVSWGWILALDGPLNAGLRMLGLEGAAVDWLGSFTWALPSLGIVGTWTLVGLCLTLFHAGLQQIPGSLYDAAAVDGAGRWREFLAVTLPGLRGPVTVALTVRPTTVEASAGSCAITGGSPGQSGAPRRRTTR